MCWTMHEDKLVISNVKLVALSSNKYLPSQINRVPTPFHFLTFSFTCLLVCLLWKRPGILCCELAQSFPRNCLFLHTFFPSFTSFIRHYSSLMSFTATCTLNSLHRWNVTKHFTSSLRPSVLSYQNYWDQNKLLTAYLQQMGLKGRQVIGRVKKIGK